MHAKQRDERKACDCRADDCAKGVERVQRADTQADAVGIAGIIARQHRQRRPHQGGRQYQHQRGEEKAHQAQGEERELQPAPDGMIDHRQRGEDERHGQAIHADADFEPAVEAQRARDGFRAPPEIEAAQRQPAHKGGQHGTDRKGRRAKDQHQLAHPDHLIDKAADARGKEAEQYGPGDGGPLGARDSLRFRHPL